MWVVIPTSPPPKKMMRVNERSEDYCWVPGLQSSFNSCSIITKECWVIGLNCSHSRSHFNVVFLLCAIPSTRNNLPRPVLLYKTILTKIHCIFWQGKNELFRLLCISLTHVPVALNDDNAPIPLCFKISGLWLPINVYLTTLVATDVREKNVTT